jgi:hypothetical protein
MKTCEYCGTEDQNGKHCKMCGAKLPDMPQELLQRSDPFYYNGYVCYVIKPIVMDVTEVQFWLGMNLIERISISNAFLEAHYLPYQDPMSMFWDLFLVAKGEKDVLIWQKKNEKYPATFEVRRKENPELEFARSLSLSDLSVSIDRF